MTPGGRPVRPFRGPAQAGRGRASPCGLDASKGHGAARAAALSPSSTATIRNIRTPPAKRARSHPHRLARAPDPGPFPARLVAGLTLRPSKENDMHILTGHL